MGSSYLDGPCINNGFLDQWQKGLKKEAQEAVSGYIRVKLREDGILRSQIIPSVEITNAQLDRDLDMTVCKKIVEIEPDSPGATYVPLAGMPASSIIRGPRYEVRFGKITGPRHIININELRTQQNDLRKILNDIDVKEIQAEEDRAFMTKIKALCLANPTVQDFTYAGGLSKINWADARKNFPQRKKLKYALMNSKTFREFSKWDHRADIGSDIYAGEAYVNGPGTRIHGIQIIVTIKDDIILDNEVYLFAEETFIGNFFTLQAPYTYIEQRDEWLSFHTTEIIGIGIGNTEAFTRNVFLP